MRQLAHQRYVTNTLDFTTDSFFVPMPSDFVGQTCPLDEVCHLFGQEKSRDKPGFI